MWMSVLRIAGIVLIVLAALIVFLLLLLAAPVRYQIKGEISGNTYDAAFRVRWLFGIIKGDIRFDSENALSGAAKVCGKKVWEYVKKTEIPEETVAPEAPPLSTPYEDDVSPVTEEPETASENFSEPKEPEKEIPAPEKKRFTLRIREKIRGRLLNLRKKLKDFYDKVLLSRKESKEKKEAFRRKKEKALALWHDEKNQKVLRLVLRSLQKILRHLLPKKGEGELRYGTGDPYQTAKVFEVLSVLYPATGKVFRAEPVMDEKCTEGKIDASGRIIPLYLGILAVRIYLNRNFRKLLRSLKEIANEE